MEQLPIEDKSGAYPGADADIHHLVNAATRPETGFGQASSSVPVDEQNLDAKRALDEVGHADAFPAQVISPDDGASIAIHVSRGADPKAGKSSPLTPALNSSMPRASPSRKASGSAPATLRDAVLRIRPSGRFRQRTNARMVIRRERPPPRAVEVKEYAGPPRPSLRIFFSASRSRPMRRDTIVEEVVLLSPKCRAIEARETSAWLSTIFRTASV